MNRIRIVFAILIIVVCAEYLIRVGYSIFPVVIGLLNVASLIIELSILKDGNNTGS